MLKLYLALFIFCCGLCSTQHAHAKSLDTVSPKLFNYYADDYPPANYLENGEVKGAAVEILKHMWTNMGLPEQKINVVPWARSYRQTLTKPLTVLFSTVKTKEREQEFKWVGPIFTDTQVLVARKDFEHTFSKIEDCFDYTVATIRHGFSEREFTRMGFPNDKMVKATTLHQSLDMLLSERVDFMLTTLDALTQLSALNGLETSDFKVVWTIGQDKNYFAFNRSTPDYIIKQFQQALDAIEPTRIALVKKYNLEP